MVNNCNKLKLFYQKLIEQENFSYHQALAIYEDLHNEAVRLGVITTQNMLEGIDIDIKIAKAINGLAK
jgi:hypothetical protein